MAILRCLSSDNPSPETAELVKECHHLVVDCLVKYSRGKGPEDNSDEKVRVFPYSAAAGQDTRVFRDVPSAHFGATLANIYPYVNTEMVLWDDKHAEHNYPITRLWPFNTVCRYIHFCKTFVQHRRVMFLNYEEAGGQYHTPAGEDNSTADEPQKADDADGDEKDGGDSSDTDSDDVFSKS